MSEWQHDPINARMPLYDALTSDHAAYPADDDPVACGGCGYAIEPVEAMRQPYRVNFWIEATDYTYTVLMTLDEAEWVTGWLDNNDDVTDLHVWVPDEPLDGPLAFREVILDEFEDWPDEHRILGHDDVMVDDHDEKDCPTDDDSYTGGPGWAGDRDHSYGDYTTSVPYQCTCECHMRPGGVHN